MYQRQRFSESSGYKIVVIFALMLIVLAGCAGGAKNEQAAPAPLIPPDATGEQLFNMMILGTQAGCGTCHSLDGTTFLGPSLQGIGSIAQDRVPGMSAEEYIRQSILEPDAYVLEGNEPGTMPPHYADALNDAQVEALVEFLMAQVE
ncbi:MAG TPA: cytochrome c [Caldilineae bacterium]|nr:cytochrome c [Caldilineae bacterium]